MKKNKKRNDITIRGEKKVIKRLNPLFFGRTTHFEIDDIILKDKFDRTHQIDHIEIRQNGIFCIETKSQRGMIIGNADDNNWIQYLNRTNVNEFYNPLKQNMTHVKIVKEALNNKYRINSLIVFTDAKVDHLKFQNVVNIKDLKGYLKNFKSNKELSYEEMRKIYIELLAKKSLVTHDEHVRNIKVAKMLVNKNICPRCGRKLVKKKINKKIQLVCSNYPKCNFVKKDN